MFSEKMNIEKADIILLICLLVATVIGGVIGTLTSPGDNPWVLKVVFALWLIVIFFLHPILKNQGLSAKEKRLILYFGIAVIIGGFLGFLTSPGDYPWALKLIFTLWVVIFISSKMIFKEQKLSQRDFENIPSKTMLSVTSESYVENKNYKKVEREVSKKKTKELAVYIARSNGFGTDSFFVFEEKLHSKYLSDKTQYDIIVYQENVELKSTIARQGEFKSIELYPNTLNLLILFLKYKDSPLPFLDLYHSAWKDSVYHRDQDTDKMIDSLKHAVSILRKIQDTVSGFSIPYAKRNSSTYICKGNFKFCLVLKKSTDQLYTLQVN